MLKRRSSVSNCCRIESSNRLNSIFIKFNFFIFLKYFCKGGPGPWGPSPRSATATACFDRQDNVSLVEFFEGGKSMFWPWRRHVVSCLVYSLGEHLWRFRPPK